MKSACILQKSGYCTDMDRRIFMKNDDLQKLIRFAQRTPEPENLFFGKRLSRDFCLPDNVLVFCHDYTSPAPNSHKRCTLVFPLDSMIYFAEQIRIPLDPGAVLFIPPHTNRFLHPDSAGYRRLFITFEMQNETEIRCMKSMDEVQKKLLRKILLAYRNDQAEDCIWHLYKFMQNLKSGIQEQLPQENPLPVPVMRALEYIGLHFGDPAAGCAGMAEYSGVSESHLRAVFTRYLGLAPGKYMAKQRLDAAKHKLLRTNKSIGQIAQECGFASAFVFSSFFKKEAGLPPSRFRTGCSLH